jgi:X-linked retinitis pigmentosa GTPase regulator
LYKKNEFNTKKDNMKTSEMSKEKNRFMPDIINIEAERESGNLDEEEEEFEEEVEEEDEEFEEEEEEEERLNQGRSGRRSR